MKTETLEDSSEPNLEASSGTHPGLVVVHSGTRPQKLVFPFEAGHDGGGPQTSGPAGEPSAGSPQPEAPAPDPEAIEAALRAEQGNVARAAVRLGVARSRVRRFVERQGIDLRALRSG